MEKDSKFDFSFSNKGKKIWYSEKEVIADCFAQISAVRADFSRFLQFLASPFLVEDPKLSITISYIYDRYQQESSNPIRLTDLEKKHFGSAAGRTKIKHLRDQLLGLPLALDKFFSLCLVLDRPEETARLNVMQLRNLGQSDRYFAACAKWKSTAEQLPLGPEKAFHQFGSAYARYFCLDHHEEYGKGEAFFDLRRQAASMAKLNKIMLKNEEFNRRRMFGPQPILSQTDQETPLTILYDLLWELHQSSGWAPDIYAAVLAGLTENAKELHPEQGLALFLFLENYLTRIKRLGYVNIQLEESRKLTELLLADKNNWLVGRIDRVFFLNRLQKGVNLQDETYTQRIYDRLLPLLRDDEKKAADSHAGIGMAFGRHDYEETLKLIADESYRRWNTSFIDKLRIKSYRIRAAMCLLSGGADMEDELERAIFDFDKLLQEVKKKLPAGRYRDIYNFLLVVRKFHRGFINSKSGPSRQFILDHTPCHAEHWLLNFQRKLKDKNRDRKIPLRPQYMAATDSAGSL